MPDASGTSTTGSGWHASVLRARPKGLWLRMAIAMASRARFGHWIVRLPDGSRFRFQGSVDPAPSVAIDINRARAARRLLLAGTVGFAEAYIDGDWDSPDLPTLIEAAALNEDAWSHGADGLPLTSLINRIRHRLHSNTRAGSRRNIAHHYDLGNAFYAHWLDEGMTYSSALFRTPEQPLPDAQEEKYRNLAHMLDLRADHHILEIGCGWGGFAEIAAADFGCRVTGLTLSKEQAAFARERMRAAGLSDRVTIALEDYRDVQGRFDRIASIEMFEAVGEAYWPRYFQVLRDRLRPGGLAALQVITIDDGRFAAYRRNPDFIQRHIFPGGMLPSPSVLDREIARSGLRLTDKITFGASYALTLQHWRQRFERAWPDIRAAGFDERFRRMWDYYLAYCEAGFRAGAIDVCQLRLENPA
jgi:cyclopropane-fatty-acyl-phospholipid synthase